MQPIASTAHHALLEPKVRVEIEAFVSSFLGDPWVARQWQDKTPDASQAAAILSDEAVAVFAKFAPDDSAADRFELPVHGVEVGAGCWRT